MQQFDTSVLPVLDVHGMLVGLFTAENLGELMVMEHRPGGAAFVRKEGDG
jgi:hypothetical protein